MISPIQSTGKEDDSYRKGSIPPCAARSGDGVIYLGVSTRGWSISRTPFCMLQTPNVARLGTRVATVQSPGSHALTHVLKNMYKLRTRTPAGEALIPRTGGRPAASGRSPTAAPLPHCRHRCPPRLPAPRRPARTTTAAAAALLAVREIYRSAKFEINQNFFHRPPDHFLRSHRPLLRPSPTATGMGRQRVPRGSVGARKGQKRSDTGVCRVWQPQ